MKRIFKFLFIKLPLAYIVLSVLLVVAFKWVPVKYTPLMLKRAVEYAGDDRYEFRREWVKAAGISPNVRKCAIASEDNRFAEHGGFDFEEMQKMKKAHEKKGKKIRGCSTISQQTAKNVFTFGSRTMARKALEAYYTVLIEIVWGKERIMEVYLNVAETGKGIYGIEAAARHYFGRSARKLNMDQSAYIVAAFPNPIKWNPARPTNYLTKRHNAIISLTHKLAYPEWVTK